MSRPRVSMMVTVDLDPVPGTFHTTASAINSVQDILKSHIPHYKPVVTKSDLEMVDSYVFDFSESLVSFDDLEFVIKFLRVTQHALIDTVNSQGYLFLNDALKVMGLNPIRDGQIKGWTKDNFPDDGLYSFTHSDDSSEVIVTFRSPDLILDKVF